MNMKRSIRRGLSLIELLIIVAILGILAAIVLPTFSNANETAKAGALASQINTVKKALILYKTDHNDVYPPDAQLILRPNRYDPKRAHLVVYNWPLHDRLPCNPEPILRPGDHFQLRNAQDYFGPPVLQGVYDGQPLQVPMTSARTRSAAV